MVPAHRFIPGLAALLLPLAFALAPAPAHAIYVCGDGICQSWGIPPETPQTCQADCGYCGDGICGYPETCSSCLSDCRTSCLNYTLSSPLKQSGCSGDDDGDCLDNAQEANLAWIVAPWYFYDEDENCSGAWYTQGPVSSLHYGRKDFFQVRPAGSRVDLWQTGSTHTAWITYFLLHPHDCQSHLGFGGHQGDSEHVRFEVRSLDLRTWVVTQGEYHHHGRVHNFTGAYLKARASEIGTSYASVAADEDGHGSWPGEQGSKSACAGSEDDFCLFGTCDCFRGTMAGAFANGYRETLSTTRNIGGPSPEHWRTSVVSTSGGSAYSTFAVGHGSNREYWTPQSGAYMKFCGWECSQRDVSSGDCLLTVHSETGCADPLSGKVDTRSFTNGLATVTPGTGLSSEALTGRRIEVPELGRLQREVADTLYAVWRLPVAEAWSWEERIQASRDPVGVVVPTVAGRSPGDQVATLRWMLEAAPDKADTALAEGILDAHWVPREERTATAAEILDALARILESCAE